MAKQLTQGDGLLAGGRELGPVTGDRRIELQLALGYQLQGGDGGECLGTGKQIGNGVAVPGFTAIFISRASPDIDDRAAAHLNAQRRAAFLGIIEQRRERFTHGLELTGTLVPGLLRHIGRDAGNDKRTAIEFAVEHLVKQAPRPVDEIALPAGAPFGEVRVDKAKCTMCLACVGACPESALMDGVDVPLLKFLERNCVQCGLCESTCPEMAITLSPRLLLTPAAREARVLNETQPFHCVICNKPFGTKQMVDAMIGRLATHSMFSGTAGSLARKWRRPSE